MTPDQPLFDQPVRLSLSAGARRTLMARLRARDDAELLRALEKLNVRSLTSDREERERYARLEATELVERIAQGRPLPQLALGCPTCARRLRDEKPQFAPLLSRAALEPARLSGVAVLDCAEARDWLARRSGARAFTARELLAALPYTEEPSQTLGADIPQAVAPLPMPPARGERLRDVLRHAIFLQTGRWPQGDFLRLEPGATGALLWQGSVTLGGQVVRVASACGAESAMRWLEQVAQGRASCCLMEISTCADCRA